VNETDRLLSALDAAPNDAARAALLAGCSPSQLAQLNALLAYLQMQADVAERCAAEKAAFEAFSAELDAAPDDAARLQIIDAARSDPQRGAGFVSEWAWRRTATVADWSDRYLALVRGQSWP
jgi:hypothetical protein